MPDTSNSSAQSAPGMVTSPVQWFASHGASQVARAARLGLHARCSCDATDSAPPGHVSRSLVARAHRHRSGPSHESGRRVVLAAEATIWRDEQATDESLCNSGHSTGCPGSRNCRAGESDSSDGHAVPDGNAVDPGTDLARPTPTEAMPVTRTASIITTRAVPDVPDGTVATGQRRDRQAATPFGCRRRSRRALRSALGNMRREPEGADPGPGIVGAVPEPMSGTVRHCCVGRLEASRRYSPGQSLTHVTGRDHL